jgi:hypothetical protein
MMAVFSDFYRSLSVPSKFTIFEGKIPYLIDATEFAKTHAGTAA